MGSSARHSNGRKAGASHARKGKRKTFNRNPLPSPSTRTIAGVLASFDEAVTLIATATSSIEGALDSTVVKDAAEPAEKIECLVRGVKGLRRARIEIAAALHEGGLR